MFHPEILAPVLVVLCATAAIGLLRRRIDEQRWRRRMEEHEAIRARHMDERDKRRRRFEMATYRQRSSLRRPRAHPVQVEPGTPDIADPSLTVDDWRLYLTEPNTDGSLTAV